MPKKKINYTDWKDEYQRKLVSAEEAVGAVKSGDRVFFSFSRDPFLLCQALADRYQELRDVSINMMMAQTAGTVIAEVDENMIRTAGDEVSTRLMSDVGEQGSRIQGIKGRRRLYPGFSKKIRPGLGLGLI